MPEIPSATAKGPPADDPMLRKARLEAAMRAAPADIALRAAYFEILAQLSRSHFGPLFAVLPHLAVPLLFRGGTSDVHSLRQFFHDMDYDFEIPRPRRILDLGAYCGYAAVYFANRFPDAEIICVEPPGPNFAALTINTAAYRNIACLAAAAWHRRTQVVLAGNLTGDWGNYFAEGEGNGHAQPVPAYTISDILELYRWDSVDFIKCIVEGAQVEMLSSPARPWLEGVGCVITRPPGGMWGEGDEETMRAAFPDAVFDFSTATDILVFRRRSHLAKSGEPMPEPLPLIPASPGLRRFELANVANEFDFYKFDDAGIQLTPNRAGAPPATIAFRLDLAGHRRFAARIGSGAGQAGAVRFGFRLRDGVTGAVVEEAHCTVPAGAARDWEVGFAPSRGPHQVALYTETPAGEDAGREPLLATFVAPTLL